MSDTTVERIVVLRGYTSQEEVAEHRARLAVIVERPLSSVRLVVDHEVPTRPLLGLYAIYAVLTEQARLHHHAVSRLHPGSMSEAEALRNSLLHAFANPIVWGQVIDTRPSPVEEVASDH